MATVYFSTARTLRWDYHHSVPGKLESLLGKMKFSERFTRDEWVAIKTHWGSHGAFRIIPPVMIRKIVEERGSIFRCCLPTLSGSFWLPRLFRKQTLISLNRQAVSALLWVQYQYWQTSLLST